MLHMPNDEAPPPDREEWMQDIGSILDKFLRRTTEWS
jgi:hypothetical protein